MDSRCKCCTFADRHLQSNAEAPYNMNTRTEELYLEAEADIRNSNFHEAFRKYEEILYEEPDYAPAHNSLGWIYKTQFENFQKAEVHFKAAIASDPLYPHPYFHMASILVELERFEELREFLDRCLGIRTLEKDGCTSAMVW